MTFHHLMHMEMIVLSTSKTRSGAVNTILKTSILQSNVVSVKEQNLITQKLVHHNPDIRVAKMTYHQLIHTVTIAMNMTKTQTGVADMTMKTSIQLHSVASAEQLKKPLQKTFPAKTTCHQGTHMETPVKTMTRIRIGVANTTQMISSQPKCVVSAKDNLLQCAQMT